MTDHPITPPLELVQQWWTDAQTLESNDSQEIRFIANVAARWGADQELEACCGFIGCEHSVAWSSKLRAARRPKPPSLKEQALAALREAESTGCLYVNGRSDLIRRALEQLNDE